MSYSDESASSLTPFNGDPTGDIFASQDVVARSPLTSTRVVETQSGFLIVVKDVPEKERLSLSVKRQIGTPPTSNILMTMDESKKLSHILFQAPDAQEQMQVPNHLRETSDRIAQAPTYGYADRPDAVPYTGMQSPYSTQPELDTYASTSNNPPTIDEMRTPYRVRRGGSNQKTRTTYNAEAILDYFSNVKKRQLAIGGVALVAVVGIVIGAVALIAPSSNKAKRDKEIAQTTGVNAVDPVDSFARSFVTNLLDFNPSTYRVSQIKAMAVMEPELMERHWQETKFPLSKRTLSNLPEGQQVVIDKVSKEATSSSSYDVEIRGSVTSPGKDSSPLALKLEISKTLDGQFLVTGQKDLSSTEVQTKSDASSASSSTSTDQEQTESTKKKASIDLSNAANLTPESESSSRATTTADASSTEVTSADPLTQE